MPSKSALDDGGCHVSYGIQTAWDRFHCPVGCSILGIYAQVINGAKTLVGVFVKVPLLILVPNNVPARR